ncbi:MAG: primosomal protein N' [Chloroflexi bacterium RBG_16_57_8]|nr:MAG: primosomal protein N' [Chloroflexi bacterium RBG_16_57_8]
MPPGLMIDIGQAVRVPFGSRLLDGIVVELTAYPSVEETKDIDAVTDERPLLTPARVSLARWISEYYLSPLFDAISLMLPPGFERRSLTFLYVTERTGDLPPVVPLAKGDVHDGVVPLVKGDYRGSMRTVGGLTEEQRQLLERVREEGRVGLKLLERAFGRKKAQAAVSSLVRRGIIARSYELAPSRAKPKLVEHLSLAGRPDSDDAVGVVLRSKKQVALLDFLAGQSDPVPWPVAKQATNSDRAAVNVLVKKGLVTVREVPVTRDPLAGLGATPSRPLVLAPAQESAFRAITATLEGERRSSPPVFLLHGVTGSGKTEVYLQSLAEAVRLGKRGIVLVPEISLTPQTITRFASRFPKRVAVLHSQLSPGEQFDEWQRIRNGEFDVVVGARSAIFAPQPDLGLIIIDEEHEWTYKQQDKSPRYHTRDVAVKLAGLAGATVVLGSATPDVETVYGSQRGDYQLLSLPERVTPVQHTPLPAVGIVDMREELKSGNSDLFSHSLCRAISTAVAAGEQVILFLNRRGAATIVQCRRCGFVMRCRRCEVTLTYHSASDTLVCHQCNYRVRAPGTCPRCLSPRIKYLGVGTQKLEEEASRTFAPARVLRWDSDVTKRKDAHQDILSKFLAHEADILVGTQIITKGLDIPAVTVVGVVSADTGLNLPDFRAGERAFQLLSQVAGRAGRGPGGGRVFFQTYSPEHYAIQAAAKHDYAVFYEKEIAYRRQLNYPPFSRLASLVYSHTNEGTCQREAQRMKAQLDLAIVGRGIQGISMIGPAPAFIQRLRGRFRWQIILRGSHLSAFLADIPLPRGWTVDVDPVGLA